MAPAPARFAMVRGTLVVTIGFLRDVNHGISMEEKPVLPSGDLT